MSARARQVEAAAAPAGSPSLSAATARALSADLHALSAILSVPTKAPASAPAVLAAVSEAAKARLAKLPAGHMEPLLKAGDVSAAHMRVLTSACAELREEYRTRREMLVQRATVTMRSFMWSNRAQARPLSLHPWTRAMDYSAAGKGKLFFPAPRYGERNYDHV